MQARPLRHRLGGRAGDGERGDYAIFIAVIASALLVFGGIAYDAPRLITARQHAAHNAAEAARVAAAVIAAGGSQERALEVARLRVEAAPRLYGAATRILDIPRGFRCVGQFVEVTVQTTYQNRSALAVFRNVQQIEATGAAQAQVVAPSGDVVRFANLPECPLPPDSDP